MSTNYSMPGAFPEEDVEKLSGPEGNTLAEARPLLALAALVSACDLSNQVLSYSAHSSQGSSAAAIAVYQASYEAATISLSFRLKHDPGYSDVSTKDKLENMRVLLASEQGKNPDNTATRRLVSETLLGPASEEGSRNLKTLISELPVDDELALQRFYHDRLQRRLDSLEPGMKSINEARTSQSDNEADEKETQG